MKRAQLVRNWFILPSCLLVLNLCIEILNYKSRLIGDPILRTLFILTMAAGGATLVGNILTPWVQLLVRSLHQSSRSAGGLGELVFLCIFFAVLFFLYYLVYIYGPETILPAAWENGPRR